MVDYALMNQYLYEGNAKEVERMTVQALAEGRSAREVMNEGLIAGMSVVGEDFKHNVLYVPEVLIAARAMKAAMAVLKPLLANRNGSRNPLGVLLMGTVRGDLRSPDRRHEWGVRRFQAQRAVRAGSADCGARHEGGHGAPRNQHFRHVQ